ASFDYEIPNHHQMNLMAAIDIEGINEEVSASDESPSTEPEGTDELEDEAVLQMKSGTESAGDETESQAEADVYEIKNKTERNVYDTETETNPDREDTDE